MSTPVPWAVRLMTPYPTAEPVDYAGVELDAALQVGRYYDTAGNVVEMGKHGTNKPVAGTTYSGGGDGQGPTSSPQEADDVTTKFVPD